ncbi:GNAT superfamily N-acetyltransferase [Kitasatospora sp. MAA4]|uniref:GNAT family N-acetyltransferase n=1 Tax=Kitasatospora sp. MAA4 TaxID=3035093 RepID=UPI0024763091|nr:GNAT family N-acetyltransferase [Kitasatospora sp. MAA4]MDH6132832.1 GNAT superfamily N-acetyltransferase [Kitasatospora sp. MAA4]
MQPRQALPGDIPELVRLRAVALEGLGVDPGPDDAPWRASARGWFGKRVGRRADWECFVVGGAPGEPLVAAGMAWVTYHLPSPVRLDGRRGYIDGMVTDGSARGQGHAGRIVGELVGWLGELGVRFVQLHASADGAPVYERAGFVAAHYPGMDLTVPE